MEKSEIKKIIATFLKVNADDINEFTSIDSRAIQGSVLLPRMYAELNKLGMNIANYNNIKTYGDLLSVVYGENNAPKIAITTHARPIESSQSTGVGIDIEFQENFPVCSDYRTDPFYTKIFTPKEISYCILRENPTESFCGKFAAKEAILKAQSSSSNIDISTIEILNDETGRPFFSGYDISISHSNGIAIAVALRKIPINNNEPSQTKVAESSNEQIANTQIPSNRSLHLAKLNLVFFILNFLLLVYLVVYFADQFIK